MKDSTDFWPNFLLLFLCCSFSLGVQSISSECKSEREHFQEGSFFTRRSFWCRTFSNFSSHHLHTCKITVLSKGWKDLRPHLLRVPALPTHFRIIYPRCHQFDFQSLADFSQKWAGHAHRGAWTFLCARTHSGTHSSTKQYL